MIPFVVSTRPGLVPQCRSAAIIELNILSPAALLYEGTFPMLLVEKKYPTLLFLCVVGFVASFTLISPAEILWQSGARSSWGWYPMVHVHFNAFLLWHDGLFSFLDHPASQSFQTLFSGIIFLLGCYALTSLLNRYAMSARGLISVATTGTVYLLIGPDHTTWNILAFLPLLSLAIARSLMEVAAERKFKLTAFGFALCSALLALPYSLITILTALSLALVIKNAVMPRFPLLRDRNDWYFLGALFFPWFFIALTSPLPSFPAYSPLGHVIADDGLPGNILPLFGPMPPIPVLDRLQLRESLQPWIFAAALSTLLLISRFRSPFFRLLFATVFLLSLDILLPEWVSQVAPLATFQRLVPWLFFFPIAVPVVAFAILLLFLTLLQGDRRLSTILCLLPWVVIPALSLHTPLQRSPSGLLYGSVDRTLRDEMNQVAPTSRIFDSLHAVAASPSYAVLKKTGVWPLHIQEIIEHWQFSSLLREKPIISTSTKTSDTMPMHDRDIATRWSPGGGKQTGNEWVYVYLPEPQTIHGIEIATGPYHTDFARGLRISTAENCAQQMHNGSEGEFQIAASFPEWEGSLTMTENGYPYFGGQGGGRIYFQEPRRVRCILIEQTATIDGFDWSIAELRTLKYPQ